MELNQTFERRRDVLYDWMAREGIGMLLIEDREGARDPAVRYYTNHPGDALVLFCVDRRCALLPWDIHLAEKRAHCEMLIPFTEFGRNPLQAVFNIAYHCKVPEGSRIEIPAVTSYPMFLHYVEALKDFDVICRDGGAAEFIAAQRAVKDIEEQLLIRKAASITDELIDLLEQMLHDGSVRTELDIALFIESEARKRGCEGTGFETLAAGPSRSYGIHAFPSSTASVFGGEGFSILDFGLKYEGYTSDVTVTVSSGTLSRSQAKQLSLVEGAWKLAYERLSVGGSAREVAVAVDMFFSKSKRSMPHALGHGIGLEAHEGPYLRSRPDNEDVLLPGMVFTIEPGLYDPRWGGCRLENDVLMTDEGPELLTHSRIIRL